MTNETIKTAIREYILSEFLPGEDAAALTDDLSLIDTAVLDSLSTLTLVSFIEEKYSISVEPHEMGPDHMETVERIANLISGKLES